MECNEVSSEFRERLDSKLAKRVLPPLFFNYFFCLLLRLNISNAHDTMLKDLGWSQDVYGYGVGAFYATYIVFQIPANACLKSIKPSRWLGFLMVCFSLLSCALCRVKTPGALYVIRLLMGVFEAGFYPGIAYCITMWFPPKVRPSKFALISISGSCSSVLAGILAYFILQMDGIAELYGWQWLFVLEASPAVLWGIAIFLGALPDPPCYFKSKSEAQKALSWLTPEEIEHIERINFSPSPTSNSSIQDEHSRLLPPPSPSPSSSGARQLLRDLCGVVCMWRIWAMGVLLCVFGTSSYAMGSFLPTIYSQYGLSEIASNLLTSPVSIASALMYILFAMLAERFRAPRFITVVMAFITLAGMCMCVLSMMVQGRHQSNDLVVVCASVATSVAGISSPMMMSWTSLLLNGQSAAIGIAFANSLGNLSGIIGPQLMARSGTTYTWALSVIALMLLVGCIATSLMYALDKTDDALRAKLERARDSECDSEKGTTAKTLLVAVSDIPSRN